jgi:Holliday junction resolvasome RuvABC endonuclease subunit
MSTLTLSAQDRRVLSIEPYWRGFGFAVLEGSDRLIEWGVKESRQEKHHHILRQIASLLRHYNPDVVVIEDVINNQRNPNMRDLMAAIVDLVRSENHTIVTVHRATVRKVLGGTTRMGIAQKTAEHFPELANWLPPLRKIWKSEDSKMNIFTAVANALAYYQMAEAEE